VLIATTIIESGLDIPNVNTIIINDAHHYGLSDLHQLRGRVGRSNKKAFCYLLAPPLSVLTDEARKRLRTIEEFSDLGSGFSIAMRDLDIRGAGNILGGEQSGFISEIGFEMYQKILDEAILELKEQDFREFYSEEHPAEFIRDCQIETDFEVLIPDHYITNITERLSLYKELDSVETEENLAKFRERMIDRFGPLPDQTESLIHTIRLRWIAKKIGERLGLGDYFNYDDYKEVIEWQLTQLGTSLEEMQSIGVKKFNRIHGSLYMTEGQPHEFNTNSGKIEFYSSELASLGFDPMPVYTPHPEPPEGFYRLIYGRAPMHTFSRTANNPNLVDLMKENSVWIHPSVADIWGLKKDQYVWLKNQDGVTSHFPVKVRLTERIRWDSVYMVHGFGHRDKKLSLAYGRGANDSDLITNVIMDPIMGGTGMRGNFVTILTENPGKEGKS